MGDNNTLKSAFLSPHFLAILGLTVLHFVLLRFSNAIPFHRMLFVFFFLNLVMIPGYIVSKIFFSEINILFRVAFSFLMGAAFFYLLLLVFSVFDLDVYYIGVLIPAVSLILVLAVVTGYIPVLKNNDLSGKEILFVPARILVLFLALIVFVTIIILYSGDSLLLTSDSPDHIAYIRTITNSHQVFPDTFMYKDGGLLTRDIRKGLVHGMWGTLNALTAKHEVLTIWPVISIIGSVFSLLSLFCAGMLLFNSPLTGLLSAYIMVLIHYNGLAGLKLVYTAYAFPFGKIFTILFLSFLLCFLKTDRKRYFALMVLSSFAATGTHIGQFIVCCFLIAVFSAGKWIESDGPDRNKLIKRTFPVLAVSVLIINMPYLLLRYIRDYMPGNAIHTHVQGIFSFSDNLYVLNPVVILTTTFPLSIIAGLSLFILWKQSARDINLRLLIWGTIGIYALIFNPFLVPIAMKYLSYLLIRFVTVIPPMLLTACLIRELWKKVTGKRTQISTYNAVIGWVVTLVLFGIIVAKIPKAYAYRRNSVPREMTCREFDDLYKEINNKIPVGSVIATDPITSYCIPAFCDQYVVCTNDQHSIPNDSTALDRILECRKLFIPDVSMKEIVQMLDRFGAGYIVINGRIPDSIFSMYWKPDIEAAWLADKRFSAYPGVFRPIYSNRSLTLYEFHSKQFNESMEIQPEPVEHFGPRVKATEINGYIDSGIPDIFIRKVHLGQAKIKRGENFHFEIEWILTKECPPGSYRAYIRFDTEYEKSWLYHSTYQKVYRKILEKFKKKRFRFREEWQPLKGIFPPDRWPEYTVIRDRVEMKIPVDISPGEYRVMVKLTKVTQYPNYTSRDLLSDADAYQGEEIGRVVIE